MTKSVILDTSAFLSLGNVNDSNYQKATQISQYMAKKELSIIIPADVFTEIINVVGRKIGHQAATLQAQKILLSDMFTIAETTHKVRLNALEMFKKQPQSVSYTDCIVMAFADEFETKDIFGFDEAFSKNGYNIKYLD